MDLLDGCRVTTLLVVNGILKKTNRQTTSNTCH